MKTLKSMQTKDNYDSAKGIPETLLAVWPKYLETESWIMD